MIFDHFEKMGVKKKRIWCEASFKNRCKKKPPVKPKNPKFEKTRFGSREITPPWEPKNATACRELKRPMGAA